MFEFRRELIKLVVKLCLLFAFSFQLVQASTQGMPFGLLGNAAPTTSINAPVGGSVFTEDDVITFIGSASDAEDGYLNNSLEWYSDLDGYLNYGATFNTQWLSAGTHVITATVYDSQGLYPIDPASITITIYAWGATPPTVQINAPVDGSIYTEGDDITFSGRASDTENGNLNDSLEWYSDLDGFLGYGATFSVQRLNPGTHVITATVIDSNGVSPVDPPSITITVYAWGATPPTVQIDTPADGNIYTKGGEIILSGSASDTEDGDLSDSLEWYSDLDGFLDYGTFDARWLISAGTHVITATVYDSHGVVPLDPPSITITVYAWGETPPIVQISAPPDGSIYTHGDEITFMGSASDAEDGNLSDSLEWYSDLDGQFDYGATFSTQWLSPGTHVITATVIDNNGLSPVDPPSITITNYAWGETPPIVQISSPADGSIYTEGEEITFVGSASDTEDGDVSSLIEWSSNLTGNIGSGRRFERSWLGAGTHEITATVIDSNGVSPVDPPIITITVYAQGETPPIVRIGSPLEGSIYSEYDDIIFYGTASDTEDGDLGDNIEWFSDLDGYLDFGVPFNTQWLSPGTHVITATVTDSHGLSPVDPPSITITVYAQGETPPIVQINSPPDGSVYSEGDEITFSGSASDAEDGNLSNSIQWSSDLDGDLDIGATISRQWLNPGTHVITATVTDSHGVSPIKPPSITITVYPWYQTPPIVQISSPADGSIYTEADDITFAGSASDTEDGDLSASIQWWSDLDGLLFTGANSGRVGLSIGRHVITATVTDSLDLSPVDPPSFTITVSDWGTTPPTTRIISPSDGNNYFGVDIAFIGSASDAEDGDLSSSLQWWSNLDGIIGTGANFTLYGLSDGTHVITATVTDYEGLSPIEPARATITLSDWGESPPAIQINSPANGSSYTEGDDISLSGYAFDFEDGVLSSSIQWSSNTGPLGTGASISASGFSAGIHEITATVTDIHGHSPLEPALISITVYAAGSTPPTTQINLPANGNIYSEGDAITFSGSASDVEDGDLSSGIHWWSDLDGLVGIGTSISSNGLRTGTHVITAMVADSQSLAPVDPARVTITVFAQGLTPPTTQINTPSDDSSYIVGDDISFSGSASDAEDGDLSNNLDWYSNLDGSLGGGPSISTNRLRAGTHVITATVVDSQEQGPLDPARITVRVYAWGNSPPTTQINSPADGSAFTEGDEISFSGSASDAESGDLGNSMRWFSDLDGFIDSGSSFSTRWLRPGTHVITAMVTDGNGYGNSPLDPASITITVIASTPPSVSITAPANGSSFNEGDVINFRGNASDAEDGDLSDVMTWRSSRNGVFGSGGNLLMSTLTPAVHFITATVTDSVGLTPVSLPGIFITVNANTEPTVNITAPADGGGFDAGDMINFSASASDAEDGDLSGSINWTSDLDGAIGSGANFSLDTLSLGVHSITAMVSDSLGASDSASVNLTVVSAGADSDDDGMPDSWEISFGLNPLDSADRLLDGDLDGSNSFLEYQGGSNPNDDQDIPPTRHYVLNPVQAGQSLSVVSLVAGNVVTMGATTLNLDANQLGVVPAVDVTQAGLIQGIHAYSVGSAADVTDMPVAGSFAGTEFVIPQRRSNHFYYLLSLQGDASVDIDAGSGLVNVTALQDQVYVFNAGAINNFAATIRSDLPILVVHGAASSTVLNRDLFPVPPAARDLWGPRRYAVVGALEDNTTVTVYGSGGQSEVFVLNANGYRSISIGNSGGEGADDVIHLVADKPVAAIQQADGDGVESVAYFDPVYFGNRYAIPVDTQYVEVICTSNTEVTLYDGANPADRRACTSDGIYPGKVYFGSVTDGVNIGAGAIVKSDTPIYLMYESAVTNDEHNLLGGVVYPGAGASPLVTIVNPADGWTFNAGAAINLSASVDDGEDDDLGLMIEWSSDLDGALGSGANLLTNLSTPGLHNIVANAEDIDGNSGSASITITINALPELNITSPSAPVLVDAGDSLQLIANAFDPEQGDLSASIIWTSSRDSSLGFGPSVNPVLSLGSHVITAIVVDNFGATSSRQVNVTVLLVGGQNDADGDGLTDAWELAYGLDPLDPADRYGDADADGYNNSIEFIEGSVPNDELSIPLTRYFVLNPVQAGNDLSVVSLVDNNTIAAGNTTLNLDQNQIGTIPASDITQGVSVQGTGAFSIGSDSDATDMPAPSLFAGTEFVIPHMRNTHAYHLYSPSGNASVDIDSGSGVINVIVNQDVVVVHNAGSINGLAATVRSTLPILVVHRGTFALTVSTDVYPVPPAALELWGPRRGGHIGALEDNTTVQVYTSSGLTQTLNLNAGQQVVPTIGNDSAEGVDDMVHLVADKPIAAIEYADSDGAETSAYHDRVFFGRRYGIPVSAQYIEVGCAENATVTLYDGANPPDVQSCTASDLNPGKVYFGATVDGANIGAGAYVVSDVPVFLMYEASTANDEHNLLGH